MVYTLNSYIGPKITIVGGAGHVGVPLALAFTKAGAHVNINDTNLVALANLEAGVVPFMEQGAEPLLEEALAKKQLTFTSTPEGVWREGPVIITIGTPVDSLGMPFKNMVPNCVNTLLPYLSKDQLIVLRSTVYPGTTEAVDALLIKEGFPRRKLAFCPERIVQGNGLQELAEMPQIISGTTPRAVQEAKELFQNVAPRTITVSPKEAELAKLFANTYRYLEFAATNQFYMIADEAGANYKQILRAMRHDYPRAAHIPNPGFAGGPCLLKDSQQLTAYAASKALHVPSSALLSKAAVSTNNELMFYVADKVVRALEQGQEPIVGLLGTAFKAESDDRRGSMAYTLWDKLRHNFDCKVLATDPYVKDDPSLAPLQKLKKCSVLVLCTPHATYKHKTFWGKPVIDIWGFLTAANTI